MIHRLFIIRGLIILAVAFILILIIHYSGLLGGLENIIQGGVNTVSWPINQGKTESRSWITRQLCSITPDKQALQDRVNTLMEENAQLSQSLREYEQVKNISEYSVSHPGGYVLAHIIGTVSQVGTQALILDKGLKDGVKENYAVMVGNGILMGKTAHVTDTASHVILLNDRRSTVATAIANNSKATGLVQGEFGLGLTMKYIHTSEIIQSGDVVVTSGFESGIPGGLAVGIVDQVHKDPVELFQSASISPPLRYDELNVVSIIKANP
ncbi:MAG: rod shape-determining protein MreC [bacterium]|nr:rod shape-determining protein MreC [bacterium]